MQQISFYSLLFSLIIFPINSFARCNSSYGDHILNKALKCNGENISLSDITEAKTAADKVLGACMDGCYSGLFDDGVRAECEQKYAQALLSDKEAIQKYADNKRCSFSPNIIEEVAKSPTNNNDPFASCFWVTNSIISPNNSACGRTPACVGIGYCLEGEYSKQQLKLQCEASPEGKCPSFSVCAAADDPVWLTHEKTQMGPNTQLKNDTSNIGVQR